MGTLWSRLRPPFRATRSLGAVYPDNNAVHQCKVVLDVSRAMAKEVTESAPHFLRTGFDAQLALTHGQ